MAMPGVMAPPMGMPSGLQAQQQQQQEQQQQRPPGAHLSVTLMCKNCREDPPNLVEEFSSGDTVCGTCGLVLGDRIIDTRSEWRTFSNDEGGDDPSRVGGVRNDLLNGSQLDTIIAGRSAAGTNLAKMQGKNAAVRGERSLMQAYKDIGAMAEAISLPRSIQDIAKHLYKRVDDSKALKGKSQESIIAAAIFLACRQGNVPRTIKEICTLTSVSKKELGKAFKALEQILQVSGGVPGTDQNGYAPTRATSAAELMIRFCNKLGLSQKIVSACQDLALRAQRAGTLDGRSPISVAAAGIYMVSYIFGDPRSPKQIGDVASVSDSTIRTSYRFLWGDRHNLIDPAWHKGVELDEVVPKPLKS